MTGCIILAKRVSTRLREIRKKIENCGCLQVNVTKNTVTSCGAKCEKCEDYEYLLRLLEKRLKQIHRLKDRIEFLELDAMFSEDMEKKAGTFQKKMKELLDEYREL
jgi:formate-dependent nitrite reductase cytochrome c552 subunit